MSECTAVSSSGVSFENVVRVLKKYPYSKHLLFLDVLAVVSSLKPYMSVYSIVIKSEDASDGFETTDIFSTKDIHVGDLLLVQGEFQLVSEEKKNQLISSEIWERECVIVRKSEGGAIKCLSKWDVASFGVFTYEETKYLAVGDSSINSVTSNHLLVPSIVLQTKNKASDKTLSLLRMLYPASDFRESTMAVSKSGDRLILGFKREPTTTSVIPTLLLTDMARNDLLSQAIARIYPVDYLADQPALAVHPHLETAIDMLSSSIVSKGLSSATIRIQTFPRCITKRVIAAMSTTCWAPHGYSHVLSVVLVDAVWMLSLVESKDIIIGDIYENSNKFGVKSSNGSALEAVENGKPTEDRVCKSINKLHEIMSRNDWIYASSSDSSAVDRVLYSYGLCLDVGSSPGGWSTYLARHLKVRRVVSVDKGAMNVSPDLTPPIEHWQMLGQDAVEKLRVLNHDGSHLVDLYCCDANISPLLSSSLLIKCVEYGLFRDRARFVLTLKNTIGNQREWLEVKNTCIEQLKSVFGCSKC